MDKQKQQELIKLQRRYENMRKRSLSYSLSVPTFQQLYDKFKKCKAEGFLCYYCNREMQIVAEYPYGIVFSLDHMTALAQGGNNDLDNLVFCCVRCNLVKGTLNGDSWKKIIRAIQSEIPEWDIIMDDWFKSAHANKIERVKNEGGQNE